MSDDDVLSQLLITKLLEDELGDISSTHFVEQLQLSEMAPSLCHNSRIPEDPVVMDIDKDFELALQIMAQDSRMAGDAAYAAKTQLESDASFMASRHYAQQIAATERKVLLDSEFARRIQDATNQGQNVDHPSMQDAEQYAAFVLISDAAVGKIIK
jgi:hypothetical protein